MEKSLYYRGPYDESAISTTASMPYTLSQFEDYPVDIPRSLLFHYCDHLQCSTQELRFETTLTGYLNPTVCNETTHFLLSNGQVIASLNCIKSEKRMYFNRNQNYYKRRIHIRMTNPTHTYFVFASKQDKTPRHRLSITARSGIY